MAEKKNTEKKTIENKVERKTNLTFDEMCEINVSDYIEQKNGLNYLSWANAWREFKKVYPNATYEVKKFENGLPYAYDENTGYMVYTSMTVDETTHEMWLPVMDFKNNAMKNVEYQSRNGKVAAATMFDINKAIMRCLAKNMAMFGLGLYLYAGEDLPEDAEMMKREEEAKKKKEDEGKVEKAKKELKGILEETNSDVTEFLKWCSSKFGREIANVDAMELKELEFAIKQIKAWKKGNKNG